MQESVCCNEVGRGWDEVALLLPPRARAPHTPPARARPTYVLLY